MNNVVVSGSPTVLKGKRLEIKQKAQEPHNTLFFISMTSDLIIIAKFIYVPIHHLASTSQVLIQ